MKLNPPIGMPESIRGGFRPPEADYNPPYRTASPPADGEHSRGIAPFNRRQFPGPETIEGLKPLHHHLHNELRGKGACDRVALKG